MQIETIKVGMLQANCYIVTKNNATVIIDPGFDAEKIIAACQGKNVVGILITHYHFDHVGALEEVKKAFNVDVGIPKNMGIIEIATPGHKEDSKTYYFADDAVMFTGDFLFKGTIGRMDLDGGSVKDMQKSLAKIKKYPDDITIYPGHGDITNLGIEKKYFESYLKMQP